MKSQKMMFIFFAPIALAVVSNVFYHLLQKATPTDVNPFVALAVTYATALAACLVLLLAFPSPFGAGESLARINWASIGLGVAIVGLEVGYLLAYRMGWQVSLAGLISNVTVGLILLPIGLVLFRERLSFVNGLGILMCIAGIILMNYKITE
jgi:drug/metabolite transporter (DMT)-like permease